MKISDLNSITSPITQDEQTNSFLIINNAATASITPVTQKISIDNLGKSIFTNLGILNYDDTNQELKAYSISGEQYSNDTIGYYLNSNQVTKLTGISNEANKVNISYDTTNKKITKTIDGTTSDIVTVTTLKQDLDLTNVENKSSATIRSELTSSNITTALGYTPLQTHQDISGKANSADLATVATSGNYNDLTNKPTTLIVEETISSTTPVINGVANHRYLCGTVTTISITPPQTGIIDVVFTADNGCTLTLPNTVKLPETFDATNLVQDTIYEINIADGIYGVVAEWT